MSLDSATPEFDQAPRRTERAPFRYVRWDGRQRIDAEFTLLLSEGLIFALLTLFLPLLAWYWPATVFRLLVIDQAIVLMLASACALALKRFDILACVVTFPLLRLINSAVLLKTFCLEVIGRQHALEWFTVARYDDRAR